MAERIVDRPINDIISNSFIGYAREVIEDRALPDVRDGLKPVQRRVLYTMLHSGLTPDKPFRKSAATVGECMKDFHPHGDASIYSALVKMAQTFDKRYILVEGHGNFGTIDDSPAAMRYTESRLAASGMLLMKDIDKDTVEWQYNYDDSMKEPVVMPAMLPNLIVNGSFGIAVGMATSIPPHNLTETINTVIAYMKKESMTTAELLDILKGPDFPTGGVVSPQGLLKCYEEGIGGITIRSRVLIEDLPNKKKQLVITEIPYGVSKNSLLLKIGNYVDKREIKDIVDIRDESDKSGCRVVIEMSQEGNAEKFLDELYKNTDLQVNFHYNMVALVNGNPKQLTLKEILSEFVAHKKEVVRRRTQYDLIKARERQHIAEGLIKALNNIDEVVKILKKSKGSKEAKDKLIIAFELSDAQAQAILDLRLQKLTSLEVKSLETEMVKNAKLIKSLESILSSSKNIMREIEKDLLFIRDNYGDSRITIIKEFEKIKITSRTEKFTLQVNENGKLKKMAGNYSGNKGITLKTDTTKNIILFNEEGSLVKFNGLTIPQNVQSKILNACNEDEVQDSEDVIFITSDGLLKKSAFSEYKSVKSNSQTLNLGPSEKVIAVFIGGSNSEIAIVSNNGYIIRFSHEDVRQIGRIAAGVKAICLDNDKVTDAFIVDKDNPKVILKTGKEIDLSKIKIQKRGGKGVRIQN